MADAGDRQQALTFARWINAQLSRSADAGAAREVSVDEDDAESSLIEGLADGVALVQLLVVLLEDWSDAPRRVEVRPLPLLPSPACCPAAAAPLPTRRGDADAAPAPAPAAADGSDHSCWAS